MIAPTFQNGWITIDDKGVQMPWYAKGVLDILDKMNLKGKRVFEYGGGNSTLWYRSRGAIVEGVDSNAEWAKFAGIRLIEDNRLGYLKSIYDYPKFDIVCIDGIFRDECLHYALERLNHGGMIIIDNFEQPSVEADWPETREYIDSLPNDSFEIYPMPPHPDYQTLIIYT